MGSLLEFRKTLTSYLPASCRSRSKSISHKKFWFLCIVFIYFIALIVFYLFLQITRQFDIKYVTDVMKFDRSYKYIKEKESNNTWINMLSTFRNANGNLISRIKKLIDLPQYAINKTNMCIRREYYLFEFLRIFGINPLRADYYAKYTLVIGAQSSIGQAVISELKERNIKYLTVNNSALLDFTDKTLRAVLDFVQINSIIICDTTNSYRHSEYNVSKYINKYDTKLIEGIVSFSQNINANITFIKLPYADYMTNLLSKYKSIKVIEIPYFIDKEISYDPRNIFIHSISECNIEHFTTIDLDIDSNISSLTSKEIGKYILEKIEGNENIQLPESEFITIRDLIEELKSNCNILLHTISYKRNQTTKQEIPKVFTDLLNYKPEISQDPYLSIVVVGRHDGFSKGFENRAQNFLDVIGNLSHHAPLASFEIVFVDYATPIERKPLSKVFKIPKTLLNKTRFISVPQEYHYNLTEKLQMKSSFFEYIAKNIGIRRSKGQFILTTNPDNFYSADFFESIARRELNDGILYRAHRWSLNENASLTKSDIFDVINRPGQLKKRQDVKARCPTDINRTVWFADKDSIEKDSFPCGAGDFLMMSRDMWFAIGGFDEYPGNMNVDALFLGRMMKFVPGYVRNIMRAPIVHQYHVRQNIFRPLVSDHEKKMSDYACSAMCKEMQKYENEFWGIGDAIFNETVI